MPFNTVKLIGIAVIAWMVVLASHAAADPRYVIYYDSNASPASAIVGLPYTDVILTFLKARVADGNVEIVIPDNLQAALPDVAALKADGKVVLVSFGGGEMRNDEYRRLVGRETELATAIAGFVAAHSLDGVDLDFEVSEALHDPPPRHAFDGRKFLIKLTQALAAALPADATITHAPQGPYFNPDWHGGPYVQILTAVGGQVTYLIVQYYNNPGYNDPFGAAATDPWTYQGLAGAWSPEKIVVAKPVDADDAGSGYEAPRDVLDKIVKPLVDKYGARFGGLAGWQFSTMTDDHRFWNTDMAAGLHTPPAEPATPSAK